MAIYTQLPIYHAAYNLLLSVNRMLPDLPRICRYTIGQDVTHDLMEILTLIYRASRSPAKSLMIGQMRDILQQVQVRFRLLSDMRSLSMNHYAVLIEQTESMSKQMAAWEKSTLKIEKNVT